MTSTNQPPDLMQLITALQRPAAYPHPVDQVQVIQTHASCVFLTPTHVYKVKKPVNFGFLDYSTLELRHKWCEAEIELNRRLCPDLYLDVVPITRLSETAAELSIDGPGEPVEWAVRMLRLRDADLLPARLEAQTIGSEEIDRIGLRLADFHTRAFTGVETAAFGSPGVVRRVIGTTLSTMDRLANRPRDLALRQQIRSFLEAPSEPLLQRRMADGLIRDCHGDLRAQNICLDPRYDDGIQVFDCIEFNPELRKIDVAADIAYLVMDLDLAGRPDLAVRLITTYKRATGDTGLQDILPYYLAYRAVVRGNIALLAASESEITTVERMAHRATADAAYDLARCYSYRRQRPALIILRGFSGSGKSTLARELSRRLPALVLSSDRVRKDLAGQSADAPLPRTHYAPAQRAAVYAELRRRAIEGLRQHLHVILDATFLAERERAAAARLAAEQGAEFWIIDCQCPDPILRGRLTARRKDRNGSDADLAVYRSQLDVSQPVRPDECDPNAGRYCLMIDTSQRVEEAAAKVVATLCSTSG